MAEPYLGQIIMAGFSFAPQGYALCNGQLLSISQYSALYALLGTTYGGNGQSTFALPNLQGRQAVHTGQGAGLSSIIIGQTAGAERTSLSIGNLAIHNHLATATASGASSTKATLQQPATGAVLARGIDSVGTAVPFIYQPAGTATDVTLGGAPTVNVGATGGGTPVELRNPYLGVTHAIAVQGLFPSRN